MCRQSVVSYDLVDIHQLYIQVKIGPATVRTTQPLQKLRNQLYLHYQLHQHWHMLAGQVFAPVDHTRKPHRVQLPNTQQKKH